MQTEGRCRRKYVKEWIDLGKKPHGQIYDPLQTETEDVRRRQARDALRKIALILSAMLDAMLSCNRWGNGGDVPSDSFPCLFIVHFLSCR